MAAVQWTTASACRSGSCFHDETHAHVLLRTVSFTRYWISRSGSLMRDSEESQWNYITHDSMHGTRSTSAWSSTDCCMSVLMFMMRHTKRNGVHISSLRGTIKKATLYRSIMYITLQPMELMHTLLIMYLFNVSMIFINIINDLLCWLEHDDVTANSRCDWDTALARLLPLLSVTEAPPPEAFSELCRLVRTRPAGQRKIMSKLMRKIT